MATTSVIVGIGWHTKALLISFSLIKCFGNRMGMKYFLFDIISNLLVPS